MRNRWAISFGPDIQQIRNSFMTTYTLPGVHQIWYDIDGDHNDDVATFAATNARIVVPDGVAAFSYTLDGSDVVLDLGGGSLSFGTVMVDASWEITILSLTTDDGVSSDILSCSPGGGINYFLVLNGDPMPVFSTMAEFDAYRATAVPRPVTPEVGPDLPISLDLLPQVAIRENDWIRGSDGNDVHGGGIGHDKLWGFAGNDILNGDKGRDKLFGGDGNDKLNGGSQNDQLNGDKGHDKLFGGDGNDQLNGGNQNDTLNGGKGSDILNGGSGRDAFVFAAGYGGDLIEDFQDDFDTLHLRSDLWTGNLTVSEVLAAHAGMDGGDVVLTFGTDTLRIAGLTDPLQLTDDILIV
jgi:hypothetical protein